LNQHNRFRIVSGKEVVKLGLKVLSLKQNKVNVSNVKEGEECGLIFDNFDEFSVGDYIDCYEINSSLDGITNTKGAVDCF
jgi:translation initiation factor IF-2